MVSDKSQREGHIFGGPCSNGPCVMADSLRDPFPGPHPVGYAELAVYTDGLLWLPGPGRGEAEVTEGEIHSVTKKQLPGDLGPLPFRGMGLRTKKEQDQAPESLNHYCQDAPRFRANSEEEENRQIFFFVSRRPQWESNKMLIPSACRCN